MTPTPSHKLSQFWQLTKPRVTQLAVFCAVIGMLLAQPTMPPVKLIVLAALGIGLFAGAAFAMNCLLERRIDAKMRRTAWRASAAGELSVNEIMLGAAIFGVAGFTILYWLVNPLTAWLTMATFIGYSLIYTLWLKPATPQNIVIGGLSGAMPPALGWAAAANAVPAEAWILVLIIFIWTPPHFWALALYREADYRASGLPMLPVTHGRALTLQHIFLYTILLMATSLLPYAIKMSGLIYLVSATVLNTEFMRRAWLLWRNYSDDAAKGLFKYSIIYLSLLFLALLVDHYFLFTF